MHQVSIVRHHALACGTRFLWRNRLSVRCQYCVETVAHIVNFFSTLWPTLFALRIVMKLWEGGL